MTTPIFVQCFAFLLLLSTAKLSFSQPPHILFMLIDDLGWNDVSFHGSPQIPTPNIDSLAYTGIILNNYYTQPICTPSRGSLMTGKYPIKLGLQHYVIGAAEPWGLSPQERVLPQYLKELGYATHGVGKWHLGSHRKEYLPTSRGFDSFFGYWWGKKDFFTHYMAEGGMSGLDLHNGVERDWNYTGYYATELFTDKASEIIKNHDSSEPLFLYIAHEAVHTGNSYSPLQAPREYIEKFSHIKDEDRRVFAAMASVLDKSVGEVFSALHEKNMLENSIIIFSTDNGGAVEGIDGSTGSNWPLRGSKYNMWEGGVRGTAFIWSPLLSNSKGLVSENLMHLSDWLPTLYAAAGGNVEKLSSIDGYNLWPSFEQNASSPRNQILLNIDPNWEVEGIRKNQYKLIKGSVFHGDFDGWFDKEGKKKENTLFEANDLKMYHEIYKTHLEKSEVFQILKSSYKKNKYFENIEHCLIEDNKLKDCDYSVSNRENCMDYFSSPVVVNCGVKPENASTNCKPMEDYCLFDVKNDPCEFQNLAKSLPSVVQELKELLDEYRKLLVPIRNAPKDPKANPMYYKYAWIPWMDENFD